jgi:proteasome lid subunit RPN8/RPN11
VDDKAMDQEFQFGELARAEPGTGLRPDHNRHYAVVPVQGPAVEDLPIFVDLDALRDMEDHARSDTSVELGGVLLGCQQRDAAGKPFLVISDSVRARHYQATKGSFRFTHETWEGISRERDEFPADVQMVGWYHTHPDWGVFLSGMDMFICDHFFNRPLDVALVIDPCQQDRGFFQWTGDHGQRIRRTSGFYLIASRFRRAELEEYAAWLEGGNEMTSDPRHGAGYRGQIPSAAVPLTHAAVAGQQVGLWGTLALQFCLLAVIAWRLAPATPSAAADSQAQRASAARLELPAAAAQRDVVLDAKLEVLDLVVSRMVDAPESLVTRLAQSESETAALRDDLRAHRGHSARLEAEAEQASSLLNETRHREAELRTQRDALREALARLEAAQRPNDEADALPSRTYWHWSWLAVAAAVGAICGGGLIAGLAGRRSDARDGFLDETETARRPADEE